MLENHLEALYKELGTPQIPEKQSDESYFIEITSNAKLCVRELFPGFVFFANVGVVPSVETEERYIEWMEANFLGNGTGRSKLGLDETGKHVILTMHVPDDVNYRDFKSDIEEFANFADYWSEKLKAIAA